MLLVRRLGLGLRRLCIGKKIPSACWSLTKQDVARLGVKPEKKTMSTAQTIREAAVTWPMPELSYEESQTFFGFLGLCKSAFADDAHMRTYMLILAASLDGGERLPMSDACHDQLVAKWWDDDFSVSSIIRRVEEHHGIGASK